MKEKEMIQHLLHKAETYGADETEVYVEKSRSSEVCWRRNALDKMKQEEVFGVGIRVRKNGTCGFSYSTDLSTLGMDRLVHHACEVARYGKQVATLLLPEASVAEKKPYVFDERILHLTLKEKTDLLKETEQYAAHSDSRVYGFDETSLEAGVQECILADSAGRVHHEAGTFCCLSCTALASEAGDVKSGYGVDISVDWNGISARKVGEKAARRATALLGAIQPESGEMDMILHPDVARQLLGILANCFSAEAVLKHKSFLENQIGNVIGSTAITLVDDGTLDYRIGSGILDGEGTPMQRTVLMQNGVAQSYLVDRETGALMGLAPTGNGIRSGYSGLPHIGCTNLILEPGHFSEAELIAGVENGVYVTEIMGAHTANPVSGNFSLGASGILIENGKCTKPVHRMTIAGNLMQLLQQCDALADQAEVLGSKSAPSMRIRNFMVSGK